MRDKCRRYIRADLLPKFQQHFERKFSPRREILESILDHDQKVNSQYFNIITRQVL